MNHRGFPLIFIAILVIVGTSVKEGFSAPVDDKDDSGHYRRDGDYKPMPHEFSYTVDDPMSKNYYGHEEKGNEAGRTDGKYFVLLPNNRLMTVTYYVDGNSGFVPKISFSDYKSQ